MVARIQYHLLLRVTLMRDGQEIDSAFAENGEDARDHALIIVGRQDWLAIGDQLVITKA